MISTFLCFLPLNWEGQKDFSSHWQFGEWEHAQAQQVLNHRLVWCEHALLGVWTINSQVLFPTARPLVCQWLEKWYRKKRKDSQHHDNRLIPCVASQLIQQAWVCLLWQWLAAYLVVNAVCSVYCFLSLACCRTVAQCLPEQHDVWWAYMSLVTPMSAT